MIENNEILIGDKTQVRHLDEKKKKLAYFFFTKDS